MNKKSTKIILQNLLARSSHHSVKRLNKLQYAGLAPVNQVSDEAYMDKTLSNIYCDFLMEDKYRIHSVKGSKVIQDMRVFQNCIAFQLNQNIKDKIDVQQKLINSIRKLEQTKRRNEVYLELESLIDSMSISEVHEHKRYLMYIYRWALNQKGKKSIQFQEWDEGLQRIVRLKLKQVCSCQQEYKKTQEQFTRLQKLLKARESVIKGNKQQARNSYQIVFQNEQYQEAIRLQALQFLCRQGVQRKDINYLMQIIAKIKQNNIEQDQVYTEYVKKAIGQISIEISFGTDRKDYLI